MAKKKKEMDNLAKDAAAALAAGMSYGKWKAMHGDTKTAPEEIIPQGWLVCKRCGKPFKPSTYRKQKFCEYACQYAAARERNLEKERERRREYQRLKRAERKLKNA